MRIITVLILFTICHIGNSEDNDLTAQNIRILRESQVTNVSATFWFVSNEEKVPLEIADIKLNLSEQRQKEYINAILMSKPKRRPKTQKSVGVYKIKTNGEIDIVYAKNKHMSISVSYIFFFWGETTSDTHAFLCKDLAFLLIDDLKKIKSDNQVLLGNIQSFTDCMKMTYNKYKEMENDYIPSQKK